MPWDVVLRHQGDINLLGYLSKGSVLPFGFNTSRAGPMNVPYKREGRKGMKEGRERGGSCNVFSRTSSIGG